MAASAAMTYRMMRCVIRARPRIHQEAALAEKRILGLKPITIVLAR
jgi:hypothetical protein